MVENKEEYKFFLEDDMDYDDYCKNMSKDGIWASQMEICVLA